MSNKYNFTEKEMESIESIDNSIFNESQMALINRTTPPEAIEVKDGLNIVDVNYVKTLLRYVTGNNYHFQILKEFQSGNEIIVKGRLTIIDDLANPFREQFGKFDIDQKPTKFDVNNKPIEYNSINKGDAYKAAASNCLKKCAFEFGFCSDVYQKETDKKEKITESKTNYQEKKKLEQLESFLSNSETVEEINDYCKLYLDGNQDRETIEFVSLRDHYIEKIVNDTTPDFVLNQSNKDSVFLKLNDDMSRVNSISSLVSIYQKYLSTNNECDESKKIKDKHMDRLIENRENQL